MTNNSKLKYLFLIVVPVFILILIILNHNNKTSNINTDNSLLNSGPDIGNQIVTQLISFNDNTNKLDMYVYDISNSFSKDKSTVCSSSILTNKSKNEVTLDNNTKFIINEKSLTKCEMGIINYVPITISIDQLINTKCGYIGSEQLFLVDFQSLDGLLFTEFNLPKS